MSATDNGAQQAEATQAEGERRVLKKLDDDAVETAQGAYADYERSMIVAKRAQVRADELMRHARVTEQMWLRVRLLVSGSRHKDVQLDLEKREAFIVEKGAKKKGAKKPRATRRRTLTKPKAGKVN